ncbi:MAG: FAD-dependent oxidoreductase, partial [Anaerolineaceae bacterium]|nr:FAD-dependent oxidoreductase [Anaerolineaceae bacterium]
MHTYDVIVIGGGFLGLSTAYQLSKMGVRTLLLEAGDIGGGTSASCSGRAQVCEGHLDPLNITLIRDGLEKHETLEEELGASYEWRRVGIFLLIRSEELWKRWQERSSILTPAGIPTEVIDRASLQKAEPNMNTADLMGAAYSVEGMLDPLRFTRAYAKAAQRYGADIRGKSAVVGMEVKNRRITAVKTVRDTFYADKIAVMAGAWEPVLTRMAGVEVPIRHSHAEALVTERIPPMIYNNIELSDFYETIHGKMKAVAIGVHPEPNGSVDVTEAITRTDELHRRVSAWGLTAIARELVQLFPFLAKVRVVRSWGRPTSFTPDEEPLIGWAPQLDNLYVATSLVETITTVPLLSEWMAMMIQGQTPPFSLESYSP